MSPRQDEYIQDLCIKCDKMITFLPHLAYYTDKAPVCPNCIKIFINPLRKSLGKMDIWVSPKAYVGESSE